MQVGKAGSGSSHAQKTKPAKQWSRKTNEKPQSLREQMQTGAKLVNGFVTFVHVRNRESGHIDKLQIGNTSTDAGGKKFVVWEATGHMQEVHALMRAVCPMVATRPIACLLYLICVCSFGRLPLWPRAHELTMS